MTAREPGGRPEHDALRTWDDVLGDLEVQVLEVENALASARADEIDAWNRHAAGWTPPAGLAPLPPELRERAARLLQSQLDAAERIVVAITRSQRQRELAVRMSYGERPVPAFVDEAL